MARTFTIALVNLVQCRVALRREGVARLVRAGVSCFDFRLPTQLFGASWEALVDLACWAWESGASVACHSWEGRWNGTRSTADAFEGVRDARFVVARILDLEREAVGRGLPVLLARVARYRANWERDVWRGANGRANPKADEYMATFLDAFSFGYREGKSWASAAPAFDYLGFANPDRHYIDADADADGHQDDTIPSWLSARIDRLALMLYQTRAADMLEVLDLGLKAWSAKHDLACFVGVGRIDRQHGQIGDDDELARFLEAAPPELVELVLYVGNGAEAQLLTGHAGFPSLELVVPRLRALHPRCPHV